MNIWHFCFVLSLLIGHFSVVTMTISSSTLRTLVSANWLKNISLSQAAYKLRVLDVSWVRLRPGEGYKQFYLKQHIPGSMYFDLNECSTPTDLIPFPLPNAKCLGEYIGNLGIDKETHVITYDQEDNRSAIRAWWLFRYFGHPKVSFLDGGLRKWITSGFDVTSEPTTATQRQYECVPQPSLLRDYNALQRNLQSKEEQVIDARPDVLFEKGHIPHSKNIPFSQLFTEEETFKSKDDLKKLFLKAGVDLQKPVIGTCQMGVTACGIIAAANILGNTNTSLYMGSWNEWSQRASVGHASGG